MVSCTPPARPPVPANPRKTWPISGSIEAIIRRCEYEHGHVHAAGETATPIFHSLNGGRRWWRAMKLAAHPRVAAFLHRKNPNLNPSRTLAVRCQTGAAPSCTVAAGSRQVDDDRGSSAGALRFWPHAGRRRRREKRRFNAGEKGREEAAALMRGLSASVGWRTRRSGERIAGKSSSFIIHAILRR